MSTLMFRVRLVNRNNVRLKASPVFIVLMHGLPADNQKATEELFDKVYEKVRHHEEFKAYSEDGLPPGYRMDADIIEFDSNLVGVLP